MATDLTMCCPNCGRGSEADAQRQRERAAYEWRQTAEPVLRDALATLDRQGFGRAPHPCSLPLCNLAERIRALLEAEHDR